MSDPFKINEPTCISFSGGRTSAYMLWRVLQSGGGGLELVTGGELFDRIVTSGA